MEELTMIYKILSVVRDNMDNPESYESQLSPEALGLSKPKWSRIMALIKDAKFMEGISVEWSFDSTEKYPNVVIKRPEITLGGLEYLEEAKGVPEYNIKLEFDTSPLGEVEKKIESMSEHLEKAMELAGSIASTDIDLQVNAVVDGRHTEFARVTTDTEYKIQSLHFDAEKWRLEINGEAVKAPIMIIWPDNFTNEAWTRRMIVNALPEDKAIEREKRGEKLPILSISFTDGTGSYSTNNKA